VLQLSEDQPIEIPELPTEVSQAWSMRKVWQGMKYFGPAAILASMSIGAGETIVVVRTGAWASYDLLWVVLLACIVKAGVVTYMLGRYSAISGEHIGNRLVRLPGPRGWFLILLIGVEVLFAPLAWVAIAKPCGSLIQFFLSQNAIELPLLAGADPTFLVNLFTNVFILAAILVSLTLSYERLEREQLIICSILVVGTLAGTVLIWPDLGAAVEGTVLKMGQFPTSLPKWAPQDAIDFPWLNIATLFAYVGGSVTTYIVYANWVGLRGWGLTCHPQIEQIRERAGQSDRIDYLPDDPQQRRRLLKLIAPLRWDVTIGAVVLFIVTASFMIAGAGALYEQESRFEGWSLLTDQAYIWHNIHPWLATIYYITVIAALWGTLTALPEVYSRVTHEFTHAIWPKTRWTFKGLRRLIAISIFIESTIVIWCNLEFDILTQIAGFFLANLAVAGTALMAFYLNHKLPPAYRVSKMLFVSALLSTAILMVACSMSTFGLVNKLSRQLSEDKPASVATATLPGE